MVASRFDNIPSSEQWTASAPTRKQIFEAIPPKCHKRSNVRSLFSFARDLLYAGLTVAACLLVRKLFGLDEEGASVHVSWLVWTLYCFIQGTVLFGLWITGHECGHGAFSSNLWLNDSVGFFAHSVLLCPYFSWQYTHAKHHKYTNHTVLGETHVPKTRGEYPRWLVVVEDVVGENIAALVHMVFYALLGFPLYLFINASGGFTTIQGESVKKQVDKRRMDHFRTQASNLFPPHLATKVLASTLGIACVAAACVFFSLRFSLLSVARWYLFPYLVVNAWLVVYTWLHHTHAEVPHYGEGAHTWLRGATCTIDRPYGSVLDHLHHNIGSTHVLHHIDSRIPHYHAREATAAVRPVLGDLYRYDATPILIALFLAARDCQFVNGREGVQKYTSVK